MIFAITGANGFLGVHIIHHLLEQNHVIWAIYRDKASFEEYELVKSNYNIDESKYANLNWVSCELYDILGLKEIFSKCDYVIHAAGLISYFKKDKMKLLQVNYNYTKNVVNVALASQVKKLLYCSSISAISKSSSTLFSDETSSWFSTKPHSFYGYTKHLGELELWRAKEEGLDVVVVNPGIILGYGDWDSGSSQLFKNANNAFPFYSNGVTGFVGVKDVSRIIEKLCLSDVVGERFILVSENKSFKEIAFMMADQFHKKRPYLEVKGFLYWIIYGIISIQEFFKMGKFISKETVKSSVSSQLYSNEKISQLHNWEFELIDSVIEDACIGYKKSPS